MSPLRRQQKKKIKLDTVAQDLKKHIMYALSKRTRISQREVKMAQDKTPGTTQYVIEGW